MKITLIDFTGKGTMAPETYAADILIFTKRTRLEMKPEALREINEWSMARRLKELDYIANTNPGSWEFVHYTFLIQGVTRAFTHQLVRTRTAAYAQQTMRVLNVEGWEYLTGPTIAYRPELQRAYDTYMTDIAHGYNDLIEEGAKVEDARGVLPTNILTNIAVTMSLRTLVDLVRKRSSPRTQGEYREVLEVMKVAAVEAHPWLSLFTERTFDKAAKELDEEINSITGLTRHEQIARMLKLVDQMRGLS